MHVVITTKTQKEYAAPTSSQGYRKMCPKHRMGGQSKLTQTVVFRLVSSQSHHHSHPGCALSAILLRTHNRPHGEL